MRPSLGTFRRLVTAIPGSNKMALPTVSRLGPSIQMVRLGNENSQSNV